MIALIWFVAFMTAQGPSVNIITETTVFADRAACEEFGKTMSRRTADYARGGFGLDWSDRVEVAFKCEPNGQPA